MAQIMRPQKQQNDVTKFLPLVGAGIGAYYGNPGAGATGGAIAKGMIEGAQTGAGLGGVVQGAVGQAPAPQQRGLIPQPQGASAMARRQEQMSQNNLALLQQAESQLPKLPEQLRQQYAPAVIQARLLEERQRGGLA